MIKTHKPRGHYWTHASAFQQTKEIRDIRYEDCTPPEAEALVPDSDDELPPAARACKRRRIEKLADDFLNGERLTIPSMPLRPSAVRPTISGKDRDSPKESTVSPDVHRSNDPSSLWRDMETDAEILARLIRLPRPVLEHNDATVARYRLNKEVVEATEVQAQATCAGSTRLRAHKLMLGPSEAALRQAAILRARRLQRSNSELPAIRTAPAQSQSHLAVENGSHSDWYPEEQRSRVAGLSNEWLSRRKSRFSFAHQDKDEESGDELRLSNKTPSQRRRSLRSSQPRKHVPRQQSVRDIQHSTASNDAPTKQRSCTSDQSEQRASYHTAPEETGTEIGLHPLQANSQDDSQTRLLKSQGILARPCKSWATMNKSIQNVEPELTPVVACSVSLPASAIRKSLQQSAGANATKHKTGGRTESAGSSTPQPTRRSTRIRSAPTTVFQGLVSSEVPKDQQRSLKVLKTYGRKSRYPNVQSTQNGVSPFRWRCASSESLEADSPEASAARGEHITTRRPVTFASSDNIEVADRRPATRSKETCATNSLVNEPSAQQHGFSTISGRRLRSSSADISRRDSVPKASSQVGDQAHSGQEQHQSALSRESQFWPGTQAALQQAEKNLFTSPEKSGTKETTAIASADEGHEISRSRDLPLSQGREPLKQLSQEPMPSTQALIDNFAGFSTVKKPNVAYHDSPTYTPTAIGKGARKDSITRSALKLPSTAPPQESVDVRSASNRRSSGLRQSMSTIDSPLNVFESNIPLTAASMNPSTTVEGSTANQVTPKSILKSSSVRRKVMTSSIVASALPTAPVASGTETSFPSFTSGPEMSSFQAAQPRSGLPREDSSIGRTIDELTRDVLSMTDMQGVLSQ